MRFCVENYFYFFFFSCDQPREENESRRLNEKYLILTFPNTTQRMCGGDEQENHMRGSSLEKKSESNGKSTKENPVDDVILSSFVVCPSPMSGIIAKSTSESSL